MATKKEIKDIYESIDSLWLATKALETKQEQRELMEKQDKCKHDRLTLFIDDDGYVGGVKCYYCGKNMYSDYKFNRIATKLRKAILKENQND